MQQDVLSKTKLNLIILCHIYISFFTQLVSAAPSKNDETILSNDFDVVGSIDKAFEILIQKFKCSLAVIGESVHGTDLKADYVEYKAMVEDVLKHDLKKCAHDTNIQMKFKCVLFASQKLLRLTVNFMRKVEMVRPRFIQLLVAQSDTKISIYFAQFKQTDKELAKQIVASLRTQCFTRNSILFESGDKPAADLSIYEEMEFSVIDTVKTIIDAIFEKVKCSMGALGALFIESDLLDLYLELKQNVEELLKNDVMECIQTEGLTAKFK